MNKNRNLMYETEKKSVSEMSFECTMIHTTENLHAQYQVSVLYKTAFLCTWAPENGVRSLIQKSSRYCAPESHSGNF